VSVARRAPRAESGSATVLTVASIGAVTVVLAGVLVVVATVRDVHRARAAADLAALAAGGALASGGGVDCHGGASVAAANGAVLSRCESSADGSVLVAVAVERPWPVGWVGLPARVSARARAGLVEAAPP
jgi:secretion/DNA translocation related TadE-like protein